MKNHAKMEIFCGSVIPSEKDNILIFNEVYKVR